LTDRGRARNSRLKTMVRHVRRANAHHHGPIRSFDSHRFSAVEPESTRALGQTRWAWALLVVLETLPAGERVRVRAARCLSAWPFEQILAVDIERNAGTGGGTPTRPAAATCRRVQAGTARARKPTPTLVSVQTKTLSIAFFADAKDRRLQSPSSRCSIPEVVLARATAALAFRRGCAAPEQSSSPSQELFALGAVVATHVVVKPAPAA